MKLNNCSLLVSVLLFISRIEAVNYVFDEFLFSKDQWNSWKLENPLDFNPTDLLPKEKFPELDQAEYNSLDGPRPRLKSTKRPATSGLATDVEALDDDNMVEHAARASQCKTCHVLATVVWHRLTSDVLGGEDVTKEVVKSHLVEACDKDAVDAVLRQYTILKMESGGGMASVTFVVVKERRKSNQNTPATDVEEAAVSLACKNLVKESGSELVSELMDQLSHFRREAIRLLVKHDRDGGNLPEEPPPPRPPTSTTRVGGSGSTGRLPRLGVVGAAADEDEDDDYVDPDDLDEQGNPEPAKQAATAAKAAAKAAGGGAGSQPQPAAGTAGAAPADSRVIRGLLYKVHQGEAECADLNPKCGDWAAIGECERNPNYMVGTTTHRGQCRKACGVCQPEDVIGSVPALAAEVDKLSSALLLAMKNLGCGASGACLTGVSGMAVGSGFIKQQEPKRELPPGMKELPGGFILGKPWWGVPEVKVVKTAPARRTSSTSAVDPPAPSDGSEAPRAAPSAAPSSAISPPGHDEVDRVLGSALADKLLAIPSDFFIYEYLYKNHTRHYHPERGGAITEDWLLGKFTRESVSSSATGEVAGLEELDLLPGGSHSELLKAHTWPYVKQVYAGGDECVLAGGRRVVRRVEARIACSPDSKTYMLVREPDFCTYIFVIFVPQLCSLDYYRPQPKAPAGGKAVGI